MTEWKSSEHGKAHNTHSRIFDSYLCNHQKSHFIKNPKKVGFLFVFLRDFGYYARENNL